MTLTYPASFPESDRTKKHLDAFYHRFERRWGKPEGVWKREYQLRGASHFHVLLREPLGLVHGAVFRSWCSRAWYEIVGSNDIKHFRAGTNVIPIGSGAWQYLVGEFAGAKGYQEIPSDDHPGRWWGVWGLPTWLEETEITEKEFYALRRVLRRLGASRGHNRRPRVACEGMWVLSRSPARMLSDALTRAGPERFRIAA